MEIEKAIENLSFKEKEIFNRIFEIRKSKINIKNLPDHYKKFEEQEIIYIKDKILNKEVIFNTARAKRPQPINKTKESKEDQNNFLIEYDPFCFYQTETATDELGRIENESSITASNISKMADYHSLVIFKKHNLNEVEEKDFILSLQLAREWFEKIKKIDQEIKTQIFIWNYHYRAGASILHPHFQVLSYKHYLLTIENIKWNLNIYNKEFKSNYFEDYFLIAKSLKLGKEENNLKIWFSLTPEKEKGINFYGNLFSAGDFFYKILQKLINSGTESFNLCYIIDLNYGFFIDRGEISKKNSDIGSLEMLGLKVISTDPFELSKYVLE